MIKSEWAFKFEIRATHLSVALSRPPALVAGDLVVLGEHLDHVPLRQAQLVLALGLIIRPDSS